MILASSRSVFGNKTRPPSSNTAGPLRAHSMKALFASVLIGSAVILVVSQALYKEMEQPNSTLPNLIKPALIVRKTARTLELYDGGRLVKTYKMVLGFAPEGDKEIEGDGRTPEGEFYVVIKNDKSSFHLSLGLSYPGVEDAERGFSQKLISARERDQILSAISKKKMPPQKTRLGGEIYIHGGGTANDWTAGCVALENRDISELFRVIPLGTTVTILP